MSFFESAASHAPDPRPPEPERVTPPWFGPPGGVLAGQSMQQAVVFRTDRAILAIRQFDVYPTGIEFTVDLRVKPTDEPMADMPWELQSRRGPAPAADATLPDEFLRLGFAFADGTSWTNFAHDFPDFDNEPTGPVVMGRGGGGGGDRWEMRYWMWPLPPAGDVLIYAEWPMFEIEEVSAVIDATALRAAAADAIEIWD